MYKWINVTVSFFYLTCYLTEDEEGEQMDYLGGDAALKRPKQMAKFRQASRLSPLACHPLPGLCEYLSGFSSDCVNDLKMLNKSVGLAQIILGHDSIFKEMMQTSMSHKAKSFMGFYSLSNKSLTEMYCKIKYSSLQS